MYFTIFFYFIQLNNGRPKLLFMLCDPKKCKQQQNNMDKYINSYQVHSNNLNEVRK